MKQLHEQEAELLDCENTKISVQNYDSDMTDVRATSPQLDRKFPVETIQAQSDGSVPSWHKLLSKGLTHAVPGKLLGLCPQAFTLYLGIFNSSLLIFVELRDQTYRALYNTEYNHFEKHPRPFQEKDCKKQVK